MMEEGSQESIPLPGLAELKGHWHGTFDASGGGNGDTSVSLNFLEKKKYDVLVFLSTY